MSADEREPADEHVHAYRFEREWFGIDSIRPPKKPFRQTYRGRRILHALIAGDRALKLIREDVALDPSQNARSYIEMWQRNLHEVFKQDRATDADLKLADKLTDLARLIADRAEQKRKRAAQTAAATASPKRQPKTDVVATRHAAIVKYYADLGLPLGAHGCNDALAADLRVSEATIRADLKYLKKAQQRT